MPGLAESAERLAGEFWPGALTLVVAAAPGLAALVAVGIWPRRACACPTTRSFARCSPRRPARADERQRHGEPPCATADEVDAAFAGPELAGVLDAGRCDGEVSTVVEVDAGWRVVREGAIGAAALAAALSA